MELNKYCQKIWYQKNPSWKLIWSWGTVGQCDLNTLYSYMVLPENMFLKFPTSVLLMQTNKQSKTKQNDKQKQQQWEKASYKLSPQRE